MPQTTTAVETRNWRTLGLCYGTKRSVFFSPDNERRHARRRRETQAKRICGRCPVIAECREHALQAAESFGVWGGMSEAERSRSGRRDHRRPDPSSARDPVVEARPRR
ncbi:WhiB family transcriptional regulator [Rhodococcus opacus]|uniref:WhiB family transcriptional regulator n=1 Tax=Rhodococcus opacus TaxID=37919 RepID=UPI003AF31DDC